MISSDDNGAHNMLQNCSDGIVLVGGGGGGGGRVLFPQRANFAVGVSYHIYVTLTRRRDLRLSLSFLRLALSSSTQSHGILRHIAGAFFRRRAPLQCYKTAHYTCRRRHKKHCVISVRLCKNWGSANWDNFGEGREGEGVKTNFVRGPQYQIGC